MDAIKMAIKNVELKVKTTKTIKGFSTVRKQIKKLRRQILNRQRTNADPVTVRLQYQFCLRRLNELQYEAASKSLRIPITRRGFGLKPERSAPLAPEGGVQWQDVSIQKHFRTAKQHF